MEDEITFYTCEDEPERLYFEDPDEAIEEFIGNIFGPDEPLEGKVIVWKYQPMKMSRKQIEHLDRWVTEAVIENWDEEYGDPENATDITEEMLVAAREFLHRIHGLYNVWACDKVGKPVEFDIATWVRENRPD